MYKPACANVLGVQMSTKVPRRPVIHRLGYCPSHRRFRFGIRGMRVVVNLVPDLEFSAAVAFGSIVPCPPRKRTSFIIESAARHPLRSHRARIDAVRIKSDARYDIGSASREFQEAAWDCRRPERLESNQPAIFVLRSGCRPMSTVSGLSVDRVRHSILARRQVNRACAQRWLF